MEFTEDPKTGDFVQVEEPFYKKVFTVKNAIKAACVVGSLAATVYVVNKFTGKNVIDNIINNEN